jgi:hypothetical protein
MALTQEEEQQVRDMLEQQTKEKRKSVLASKANLKSWLKTTCSFIAGKLTEAIVDQLFDFLMSWFPEWGSD